MQRQSRTAISNEEPRREDRRTFLKQSLAGGIGTTMQGASRRTDNPGLNTGCGVVSVSDSLLLYLSLVNSILSEAYTRRIQELEEDVTGCLEAYKGLYKLLDQLCGELKNCRMTPHAQNLRMMVDAGRVNAQLIKASLRSYDALQPLVAGLGAFTSQISLYCQNINPDAGITLSPRATSLLKQVMELIQKPEFKKLYEGTSVEPNRIKPKFESEGTLINRLIAVELQTALIVARKAIVEAENPLTGDKQHDPQGVNKAAKWHEAGANLEKALSILKQLVEEREVQTRTRGIIKKRIVTSILPDSFWSEVPNNLQGDTFPLTRLADSVELKPVDTLVIVLSGLLRLIRRPEYRKGLVSQRYRNTNEVRFVSIAERTDLPMPDQDREAEISRLLWAHCPPGTRPQVDRCIATVLFVHGWQSFFPEYWRMLAIHGALYTAERFGNIGCDGMRDLGALAAGLARLA